MGFMVAFVHGCGRAGLALQGLQGVGVECWVWGVVEGLRVWNSGLRVSGIGLRVAG